MSFDWLMLSEVSFAWLGSGGLYARLHAMQFRG